MSQDEPSSRSSLLFEHDLFGKLVTTFPDHAPAASVALRMPDIIPKRQSRRTGALGRRAFARGSHEKFARNHTQTTHYSARRPSITAASRAAGIDLTVHPSADRPRRGRHALSHLTGTARR